MPSKTVASTNKSPTKPKKTTKRTSTKPIKSKAKKPKIAATAKTKPHASLEPKTLPSTWYFIKSTFRILWNSRQLFILLGLMNLIIELILVKGFSSGVNISSIHSSIQNLPRQHLRALGDDFGVFASLFSLSVSGTSAAGSVFEFILTIFLSLAVIWSLRQIMSDNKVTLKQAYYLSTYPIIPFLLTLLVLFLEFIPMLGGAYIYSVIETNVIAVGLIENIIFIIILLALCLLSLYLISSTIFALYIVTLPEMTPLKAMRSARDLVKLKRISLMRKIVLFPLIVVIISYVFMIPVITWADVISPWVLFILSTFLIILFNTFFYQVYREMLND